MDKPILEAEPVDERLEGRAGRAHRRSHIDLPGTAGVEVVRRGDPREHLAAAMIDRNDSDRDFGSERTRALARKVLEIPLQRRVDGQAMQAAIRRSRDHGVGRVRRQHWHRLAAVRHRLVLRAGNLVPRNDARGAEAIEHPVARIARRVRGAVGAALLR